MPIYTNGQATETGNVVGYTYTPNQVYLWPVGSPYFTVVTLESGYASTDWDNQNRAKFHTIVESIRKVTHLIQSVREHNERSLQLWPGDVVRVRSDYFDDDYAGRKFTYIDATRVKDSYGNIIEVDAGSFIKIGNGRKTEPHPYSGSDLYQLCLHNDISAYMPLLDCMYDTNIISDTDMPILLEWVENNAPFVL